MRLSELGEFGFISKIREKSANSHGVVLGIGDDAAITSITPGMSMLSTADLLAEGVHFRLDWSDPFSLGRKSLSVNLSDIAAMGGIPRYALLSLAVPKGFPGDFLDSFIDGFLQQAEKHSVSLIGGDTSASTSGLFINITLIGEQFPDRIVRRSGACCGDLVCVSGTLGDSALGLKLLQSGRFTAEQVRKHLDPTPRVELGRLLADREIPTAMIDISDGLYADLGHILKASSKGAKICIDKTPISDIYSNSVTRSSPDFYDLRITGGEEYELLFTLHPSKLKDAEDAATISGTSVTVIGEIIRGSGLFLAFEDGSNYEGKLNCYDHFALE